MMSISSSIRGKPNWEEKSKDPAIFSKWKHEADASDDIMQYIKDELEWYKSMKDGLMEISGVDGIWQADGLIPDDLTTSLSKGVEKLENVPDNEKDYHPGTDNQVRRTIFLLFYFVFFNLIFL